MGQDTTAKTKRIGLSVTSQVAVYLDTLASQGLLGATASEVAKTFVQRGIEQAIKDGFLERPLPNTGDHGRTENT